MWQFHPIDRLIQLQGFYTAFETKLSRDYVFRGEAHDFYELVLIVSGSLGVTAGTNSFILEGPAAVLHPPMEFHALRAERGTEPLLMIFSFDAQRMPRFDHRIFTLAPANIERAVQALSLLQKSEAMRTPNGEPRPEQQQKQAQLALSEIEQLLLSLSECEETPDDVSYSSGNRNYRLALQIMEQHITAPLTTPELARLAHISPSLLKKLFSRYAGVGVMEYFRARKVNSSIPHLREGRSVQEVAAHFGFSSPSYFATVFRRVTGKTPGYYHNH